VFSDLIVPGSQHTLLLGPLTISPFPRSWTVQNRERRLVFIFHFLRPTPVLALPFLASLELSELAPSLSPGSSLSSRPTYDPLFQKPPLVSFSLSILKSAPSRLPALAIPALTPVNKLLFTMVIVFSFRFKFFAVTPTLMCWNEWAHPPCRPS